MDDGLPNAHNPFDSTLVSTAGKWLLPVPFSHLDWQPAEAVTPEMPGLLPWFTTFAMGPESSTLARPPAQQGTLPFNITLQDSLPRMMSIGTGMQYIGEPQLTMLPPPPPPPPAETDVLHEPGTGLQVLGGPGLPWPLWTTTLDKEYSLPPSMIRAPALLDPVTGEDQLYPGAEATPTAIDMSSVGAYQMAGKYLSSVPTAGLQYTQPVSLCHPGPTQEPAVEQAPAIRPSDTADMRWLITPLSGRDSQHNVQTGMRQHYPRDMGPRNAVADNGDGLRMCEYRQGSPPSCTCPVPTDGEPCPEHDGGAGQWIMISYRRDDKPENTEKKTRRPRARYDSSALLQTSQTRDIGACIRCKIQRVRCLPDPADPTAPCQPCSRVANNPSRKVIHHIACHRYKLRETVLFRTTASNVTDRWHGDQVRNVSTKGTTYTVDMMQDFVTHPFTFKVCLVTRTKKDRYRDKTTRDWYDGTNIISEPVSTYALANVHETVAGYKGYIRDSVLGVNSTPSMENMAAGFRDSNQDAGIVGEIYTKAWDHFCSLPTDDDTYDYFYERQTTLRGIAQSRLVGERDFLLALFQLQFALRHATGWSWLVDGGIPGAARIEQFPPLRGRVSTPRLVVGQIDAIRISTVLKPLSKSILQTLTTWISDRQYNRWLTIFFSVFTMLVEIAKATEDAYHHGWYDKTIKRNGPKHAHIISQLHETANVVLAHWHYYNCAADVLELARRHENERRKTPVRSLSHTQFAAIHEMWQAVLRWKQQPRGNNLYRGYITDGWWEDWCHPMYFAGQMFETEWTPLPTFSEG